MTLPRANARRVDQLLRNGNTVQQVVEGLGLSLEYVGYRNTLVAAEHRPLGLDAMPGYDEEKDEAFVDLLCARGGMPRIVGAAPNVALADPWGKLWRERRV